MSENNKINGGKINISVPLDEWVVQIVKHAVEEAQRKCPIITQVKENTTALTKLKMRWVALAGYAVGSGVAGGGVVYGIMKAFGG